jgi:hypothetical protein
MVIVSTTGYIIFVLGPYRTMVPKSSNIPSNATWRIFRIGYKKMILLIVEN